jgi:predicted membrane channel-forming protein YqfA (hemolysin III family)
VSRTEEAEHEQLARNLNELLQEIRVAQAGVQILFGFLLSIAFTERYANADAVVKATHMVTVLFAAGAVALLPAPAAWHRMLFRLGRRKEIIKISDRLAIAGLASLATAICGTVLLLAEVVIGGWPAVLAGLLVGAGFVLLWFVLPARRRRAGNAGSAADGPPAHGTDRRRADEQDNADNGQPHQALDRESDHGQNQPEHE